MPLTNRDIAQIQKTVRDAIGGGSDLSLYNPLQTFQNASPPLVRKWVGNPVIEQGAFGSWDEYLRLEDVVWDFSSNLYVAIYSGWSTRETRVRIGFATADNPLGPFTKVAGNPLISYGAAGTWNQDGLMHGCLICKYDEKLWYLYISGLQGTGWDDYRRVGLYTCPIATFPAGPWTEVGVVLDVGDEGEWDANFAWTPGVVLDGHQFFMLYTGYRHASPYYESFGYAVSTDGLTWTKYTDNPVMEPRHWSWDAQLLELHKVVYQNGWWILLYEGTHYWLPWDATYIRTRQWRTGVAFSRDLRIWGRPPRPILESFQSWDGWAHYHSMSAIRTLLCGEDGNYYLYYLLARIEKEADIDLSTWSHSARVALIDPEILNPTFYPQLEFKLWDEEEIEAETEAATTHIVCAGWPKKTFYLTSDQNAMANGIVIKVDPAAFDDFSAFHTEPAYTADDLWKYMTEYGFYAARIHFTPAEAAVVSAWLVLSK